KGKVLYLIYALIPFFLISAIRDKPVGTDVENYLRGYRGIREVKFKNIFELERWEYGYVILNKISSYITDYEQMILISTSLIVFIGTFYFIYKNSSNIYLSVYLYLTLYLYLISFNIIRQAIAMSILIMGFHFIRERKFFGYLFTVIIASF